MEFINNPRKSKNIFILMLVISIVLFLGLGLMGYLYWQKNKAYNQLLSEKKTLEEKDTSTQVKELTAENSLLKKENEKLKTENTNLTKENESLSAGNKANESKMSKAWAYNDVLAYLIQIIQAHNGLNGWTEAEYQTGRTKAQATGDQSFVDLVDWAWNSTTIDQIERLTKVLDAIADGIGSNVK